MDYLIIGGVSIGVVVILSAIGAFIVAKGNPGVAFKVWFTWVKKYGQYGLILAAGIFAGLISVASKKEIDEQVEARAGVNVKADSIKGQIVEANATAKAEIAVAKAKDENKKKELEEIKKIEDPMERRKRLTEMLILALVVGIFVGCAAKQAQEYISAIPKPLDVSEYVSAAEKAPEFFIPVEGGCTFEKLPLPAGLLTTEIGQKIQISGGILISDCKAEQLILYRQAAEKFYVERNNVALVYQSLDQGCRNIETLYQEQLEMETNPDLWESIDFEAGFAAGAATCIGITYAVNDGE